MKSIFTSIILFISALILQAQPGLWSDMVAPQRDNRQIVPAEYRTVGLQLEQFKGYLLQAPHSAQTPLSDSQFTVDLPTPDGGFMRFRVVQSPIMAEELQASYPQIRTFAGQGTGTNRHASLRLDFTVKGVHAQILLPGGTFYIDPYSPSDDDIYIVYTRNAFFQQNDKVMPECSPEDSGNLSPTPDGSVPVEEHKHLPGTWAPMARVSNGTQLRTYRLALACTGEYAIYHSADQNNPTVAEALSAMVTSMNRVNGVFERDMSLTMVMVANNNQLIFLNPASDPYANTSGDLNANQTTCDNIIGSANYDIGHLFGTGGGGIAQLNSPCTSSKARGLTGQNNPIGDPFDIDYVAHEIGHQWGARHTQNNNCNRSTSAAYEPGSASTIMGYAGICAPNLQSNSDDHFHNHSFNEMYQYSVNGFGNSCAQTTSNGNTPPAVVVPAGGFFIPISTPFELTASATDPDGDLLTYCWEQYNLGPATANGDNTLSNPSGNAPIFRSWSPTTDGTRVFPRLNELINNTTVIGEHLPTYTRNLTFRCTVRDNRAGGGGVTDEEVAFEAAASAGPFLVTLPNTPINWTGNSIETVTWDVANTNATPVNCNQVNIYLSTDGGWTYPLLLAGNVPNNGLTNVMVPNLPTSEARIKVKAANNIFFDISDQNFTILPGVTSDYDVALIAINEPIGEICLEEVTPEINILNLGSETITSIEILYNLNGGTNAVFNWSGSLPSTSSINVTLPAIIANIGVNTLNVLLQNPNGLVDENPTNNSGLSNFELIQVISQSLPVTNDFEGVFPGAGWSIENPDGARTWETASVSNDANCNAGNVAYIEFYNYNASGQADDLISPNIDLSAATNPQLTFDYAYQRYSSQYFDRMQVQITEACSENWITLWDKENLVLATAGSGTAAYSPGCGDWSAESIDLTPYAGDIVRIRFRGITGWGNNLYLDNINVFDNVPTCAGIPSIIQVDPSLYACAGGEIATLTGFNFCAPVSVTVGGVSAAISSSSETEIVFTMPAGSGTANVVVTTTDGNSNSVQISYAAPLVASITPSELPCAGGAALTLIGSNFCDASSVTIGGQNAPISLATPSQIVVTSPAGSGLNIPVIVTTPSGQSNAVNVSYAAPLIAAVGSSELPCAGGATLTLSGSNFCDATLVTVGGVPATNLTELSSTAIVVTSPAGSGTNVPVQVTTPSGQSNTVNVSYAAPLIASVSPTELPCVGGAALTLIGSNFCDATSVTVGGQNAPISLATPLQIVVTSPAGSGLNVPVVVTTPSGQSNAVNVSYAPCDTQCLPGEFDNNGICTVCPPGFYCPGDGNSYPCSAGTYQSASGATACLDCEAGSFSSTIGAISCESCPVGTFQSETGSTECMACAAGTSQSQTGQTSCVDCPVGTYSSIIGAANCASCPAGTANNQTGQTACADCPPGSFSSTSGSAECSLCPADTYSDVSASTECLDCAEGSSSAPGSTACTPNDCSIALNSSSSMATIGFANGSATVTASGGLEPYTYQWNDPFMQTTATALGLFPGTYTCVVTDANECSGEIQVFVDLFTGIPTTQLTAAHCDMGGYSLGDMVSAQFIQNAEAFRWEFVEQGGSALPEYTRNQANPHILLHWVSGIALGTTYEVRIKVRIGGVWGEYGAMCTLATAVDVPLTEVLPLYTPTNASGALYAMCNIASAYTVSNATNYEWEFNNGIDAPMTYQRGSGNPSVKLSWIDCLQPNSTYQVSVRAEVGGLWGDFGNALPMQFGPTASTQLRANLCGATMQPINWLFPTSVCISDSHEWELTNVSTNAVHTIHTVNSSGAARLNWAVPSLVPGATYSARVKATQCGVEGAFGNACNIIIAAPQSEIEDALVQRRQNEFKATLYPNPSIQSEVWLVVNNIDPDLSRIQVVVFDVFGKRVHNQDFETSGADSINQLMVFKNPLAKGLYLVRVESGGNLFALERLVIQ